MPAGSERSLKDLVDLLSRHLLKAHAEGKRIVLVVDEAQNLAPEVLEQVRLLTNLETETQKLLQIILIGQPELRELLGRVELRQLAQRITGRYHLDPLSDDEAAAYVRHRLRVAGATREIFTNGALREIQRLSGGVPRLINIICDRALLGAFTEDRHAGQRQRRAPRGRRSVRQDRPAALAALGRGGAAVAAIAVASALLLAAALPRGSAAPRRVAAVAGAPAPAPAPVARPAARPRQAARRSTRAKPIRTTPSTSCSRSGACATSRAASIPAARRMQAGLECLTQRGSLAQLRLFNRPAVLNVIDSAGRAHQVVLAGLDDEHAQVDLGGAQREVGIGDLSRSWFGDYVLLWRPAAGGSQPLALGARNARVRWLRDSLRRVNGLPAEEAPATIASTPRS